MLLSINHIQEILYGYSHEGLWQNVWGSTYTACAPLPMSDSEYAVADVKYRSTQQSVGNTNAFNFFADFEWWTEVMERKL